VLLRVECHFCSKCCCRLLLQTAIPVVCETACDVRLEYGHRGETLGRDLQHNVQVGAAISHNAAFTSPYYSIQTQPSGVVFKLARLIGAVTGEQSLSVDAWHVFSKSHKENT
jgi:hypothetical protein